MEGSHDESEAIRQSRYERLVLFILASVQFITIVDFMIVMPLGPQLMRTLQINPTQFGLIVSSYTFAAGVAGIIASSLADRFARRTTFLVLFAGFLLGTLACGLAPTYDLLLVARVVTGAFGGVLGGITMAIIGDVFPEERRGRATGTLMTGFALASVAGVPFGLVLGTNFGWHVPFVVLALGGFPILMLARLALPPLDAHIHDVQTNPLKSLVETFSDRNHLNAFALIVSLMIGSFTVFPYLSAYLVSNVGMTENQLPLIYICGGALTLLAAPVVGRCADRYGKRRVYRIVAPASAVLLFVVTHLPATHVAVAVAIFGALMVCNVGRMIPAMAIVTSSVRRERRGAFLSANSSVQHVASGIGAYLGGMIVVESSDGKLENFGTVGWIAAAATLFTLWLVGRVEVASDIDPNAAPSAASLAIAAAAEASVDAGEALVGLSGEHPTLTKDNSIVSPID
ncbi:Purine efflux pump PbuE [Rosistilla carotiformis]|uniref:Purine efflux pump PbuE n=1 Tax=Rosistilla carotiformis TaxID=2528017 RepID=A0A518JTA1_9BACT|nr:MFS transporter [Rosistilla carotiformis]QDV68760.1 Purine efflux pump PbuE [Rosistilla carotiformis]